VLELRGVRYRYPGFERRALDGVDLTVGDGEIVGLTGPNGAGKSTLCLVAAGVAPGSVGGELEGEVLADGGTLRGRRSWEVASVVGLVFSDPEAQRTRIAATVLEEVAFGPMNLGLEVAETVDRAKAALAALGIERLAERDPGRLSGGETQLVAIASILAMRPHHLVLDEPVAELDPDGRRLVVVALRRLAADGTALLIAEHDPEVLSELCTRVVGIEGGGIVQAAVSGMRAAAAMRPTTVRPTARTPLATAADGAPVAIRCSGVSFRYPDGTSALTAVDLAIRAGEAVAVVGRNGSGKSTLVRTWNGLLGPTAGTVEIDGRPTAARRVAALARSVGLAFQDPNDQLFARSCRDEVAFGARNVGLRGTQLDDAVAGALEVVGLGDQAAANPFDLGPSKRRLLAIASVLAMQTPIVVLDEPTMGLDPAERALVSGIVEALAGAGRTVVAISHDARFVAESFGRAIRLDAGRVVEDGPPAGDQ